MMWHSVRHHSAAGKELSLLQRLKQDTQKSGGDAAKNASEHSSSFET
jgi:hypothetical protein